jgi:hypothetical protein
MVGSSTSNLLPIWTESDIFGNQVDLFASDWEHAVDGHPEVAGREDEVRAAIANPVLVVEAGFPKSAAFYRISTIGPEGMRVLVEYTRETFPDGNATGFVTTAYPIDSTAFPQPRLGGQLWPVGTAWNQNEG